MLIHILYEYNITTHCWLPQCLDHSVQPLLLSSSTRASLTHPTVCQRCWLAIQLSGAGDS